MGSPSFASKRGTSIPEQRTGSAQRTSVLRGIGPKAETLLQRTGTGTLANLFTYYPLCSVTYPELTEIDVLSADDTGMLVAACAEPIRELMRRSGRGIQLCTGTFSNDSGELSATRFHMPYLYETFRPGRRVILFGKARPSGNRLHLQQSQLFTRK